MRPVLVALPEGPPPTAELSAETLGSLRTMAATRSCRSTMAVNEVSSADSVLAWIWPMSSSGKKPLGMLLQNHTVATKLATATPSTQARWRRARSSVRV